MKQRMRKQTERIKESLLDQQGYLKMSLRISVTLFVIIILLAGSLYLYYHSPRENGWLICIVYQLTGLYCPGCGSGRASFSILHGHIYQAFRYNPLYVILLPWIALYLGICWIQWLIKGRETIGERVPEWVGILVAVIVVLFGIVRNIDAYPFVLLAPTNVM